MMIEAMEISMTGTATARIQDSPTSCCSAAITPPTARIGAETSIVQVIRTRICTC